MFSFDQNSFQVKEITKLKCLSDEPLKDHRKIKIIRNYTESIFFAAPIDKNTNGFTLHYMWFAKIVCNKISEMGFDINRKSVFERQKF